MYRFTIVVCLVLLALLAGISLAEIPRLINYQGMLTDDSGTSLATRDGRKLRPMLQLRMACST